MANKENWTVQTCGQDIWVDMPIDCPIKRREDICRIAHGAPSERAKRIARANLIAAAPALLQALAELVEVCSWKVSPLDEIVLASGKSNHDALVNAVAVIRSIKGE